MATILAHVKVKPGSEPRWEEIAKELYRRTHAEEQDVTRYEYWRGQAPGSYYVLLSFPSYNKFIVHQASDHHEDAAPGLGEVMESINLEWVDPIEGASPLAPTNAEALWDGANDLQKQYHGAYAPAIADWWSQYR